MPAQVPGRSHIVSSFCSVSFLSLLCSKYFEVRLDCTKWRPRTEPSEAFWLTVLYSSLPTLRPPGLEIELYSKLGSAGLRCRLRTDRGDGPDRRSIADGSVHGCEV